MSVDSKENDSMPMKVVIFAATAMSPPTINRLYQQQCLGGVVLPPQVDQFNHQLQSWLEQRSIPYIRINSNDLTQLETQLRRWETDVVICFGFSSDMPDSLTGIAGRGFYFFHGAEPSHYCGPMPHYWQIRDGCRETRLCLQQAPVNDQDHDIVVTLPLTINPLDTLQCLENNLAEAAPQLVDKLINGLRSGEVTAKGKTETKGKAAPLVQESDLFIDWLKMGSEQIAALARAGNSSLGGCILVLGSTAINLLQATVVDHPTYGVPPGTICHTSEPEGVIVATTDRAIRLDVLSNADGVFGGMAFIERFGISAGMEFVSTPAMKSR